MRYPLFSVLLAMLVFTGWGCAGDSNDSLPTIEPTWGVYENQELGFAFQYPEEYILNVKEVGDTASYMGKEMGFILSIQVPTHIAPESLLYVFYDQDMNLDQLKEIIATGYGDVEGAGQILQEETMNQGGLDLVLLENTTAMEGASKTNYVATLENGLLIFSPFLGKEVNWQEILPTLRKLK